jgi:glyoxylase-like metal-dependent hydrolase (beta-lactamase superfamily II)
MDSRTPDCKTNRDSFIQVVGYNADTWVLRQNKCVHYEAPFIFLLVGNEQSLLVDTGATADEKSFPLRHVVDSILAANGADNKKLIVAHTHSHSDHVAADEQFINRANTMVMGLGWEATKAYFGFYETNSISTIDLGNRSIKVLSCPGHDRGSVAFHDSETNLLLTGDTFYPGRLYVRDWLAFKKSIKLLLHFANENKITQLIGNHIEMTARKGIDYPVGSTYQPDEHILPLTIAQLKELDNALDRLGDLPKFEVHNDFIIYPK